MSEPTRIRLLDGRWLVTLPDGREIYGDACWFSAGNVTTVDERAARLLDLLRPLECERASDEYVQRVAVAMRLARDLDACRALLRGETVSPDRIDPDALMWAQTESYVQLARPIDTLTVAA